MLPWTLGILALIAIVAFGLFNSFVRLHTRAKAAWSDIDTQLKKRYDLIPQLVSVVQGYTQHEKAVTERIVELRAQAMRTQEIHSRESIEQNISSELNNIFILTEQYPELKAAPQFLSLQQTLKKIEDDISKARRYYNAVVRDFNSLIASFPHSILASLTHFTPLPFFTMQEQERHTPVVTT